MQKRAFVKKNDPGTNNCSYTQPARPGAQATTATERNSTLPAEKHEREKLTNAYSRFVNHFGAAAPVPVTQ